MKPWTLPFSSVIAIIIIMLQIVFVVFYYERLSCWGDCICLLTSISICQLCEAESYHSFTHQLNKLSPFSASSFAAQDYNYNHHHHHHHHHHHYNNHITNNKVDNNNINNNYPIGEQHSERHRCDGQTAAWHQGGNPGYVIPPASRKLKKLIP